MNSNAARPQVLVVEDEPSIRLLLRATLRAEGYAVQEAESGREAEAMAQTRPPDLFIVDLGLPDCSGVELIRRLRRWCDKPIVVLSARMLEQQKVEALDAGADDYIVKPFGPRELHARLRVAQRRAARLQEPHAAPMLQLGDVRIDLDRCQVTRLGEVVSLTATQWRLLEVLARRAGRLVSARQLLSEVWGPVHTEQSHYLRIYVRQLRQRLEREPSQPRYLITEPGLGYRLITDDEAGTPALPPR